MGAFNENVGRILSPKETQSMTDAYRERKVEGGLKDGEYIRSEFFGLNRVQHLLDQKGCVGLRVYHAKRWEDAKGNPTTTGDGRLVPRILLTGVDQKGHDLPLYADQAGMKDMPGGGGGGSVGDGHTCPQHCEEGN